MAKFKAGDKAFIVESNRWVREVKIVRVSGGMYLIRFEGGGVSAWATSMRRFPPMLLLPRRFWASPSI